VPELTTTPPETPEFTLFEDITRTDPEELVELEPDARTTDPPD